MRQDEMKEGSPACCVLFVGCSAAGLTPAGVTRDMFDHKRPGHLYSAFHGGLKSRHWVKCR